jgi:diguanylate cyclase (GGDEF)-like protein
MLPTEPTSTSLAALRERVRWRAAVAMCWVCVVALLLLLAVNFASGRGDSVRLAIGVLVIVAAASAVLWRLPRALGSQVYFWLGTLLIMYMPLFGYAHGRTFHYWAYALPASLFFLLSARRMLAASLLFGVYAVAMEARLAHGAELLPYAASFLLLSLFIAAYGHLSERFGALLRAASETDALSGCWNRRVFNLDLAAHGAADGRGILLLLDIDHFKAINDGHGHLAGDRVIAEVGARLRAALPAEARCYRYGGEEFAVLATGLDPAAAAALADGLRRTVSQASIDGLAVTVSGGLAAIGGGHASDAAFAAADAALYRAKDAGRDRVVTAS